MATIITKTDLTYDYLKMLFEDAGFAPKVDEDGEIYISGEGVDFPFWITLAPEHGLLKIFTYILMQSTVTLDEAFAFANDANSNVALPSFYVHQRDDGDVYFRGDHILLTEFGIDTRMIIATARRFSGAFHFALNRDENDYHFQSGKFETAEGDEDEAKIAIH